MRFVLTLGLVLVSLPAMAQEGSRGVTIASWNLEWFFDEDTSDTGRSDLAEEMSAPSRAKYLERVEAIAEAIAKIDPDVLALQEVENRKVVEDLVDELKDSHEKQYQVSFVQGDDSYTQQDVAFMVRDGLPTDAARFRYSFRTSDGYKGVSKHLRLKTTLGGEEVTLITVHLVTNEEDRKRQATTLLAWTEDMVPSENLIILGDFNTRVSPTSTSSSTEMGIIRGLGTPTVKDDLADVLGKIPYDKRKTHVTGQAFDRVLLSPSLVDQTGLRFRYITALRDLAIRGDSDHSRQVDYSLPVSERDLSDHYPVVLLLQY